MTGPWRLTKRRAAARGFVAGVIVGSGSALALAGLASASWGAVACGVATQIIGVIDYAATVRRAGAED